MTSIFLTGASGYVGGQLLHELAQAHPEYTIATLVRDANAAETIAKAYPRVRTVVGDLDDSALVEQEASQALVVLSQCHVSSYFGGVVLLTGVNLDVASNKHIGSLQAIHRGLAKRGNGYLIQISGASLLPVKDLSSPSFKPGEPSSEIWDDLDGVSSVLDLIRSHDSRVVDNYILKIAKETPSIKTALVLPPIIYGKGQGPVKQRSVQIPALSKVAIERGHAVRAGRGLAAWTNVHVADLARLFTILAEKGAGGSEDENVWGEKGIYLPGVGELTWADISDRVAKAAKDQGLIDTLDVEELYKPEVDTALPAGSVFFGSNARSKPRRATEVLGWEPKETGLDEEIPRAVAEEAEARK
ncbi:related to nucleoside-diphosphate-sugar epimerase [Fusarium fujikuroi]|uniref:NAD-dependent epimerase/dehydratase domain-containing protein n=1 Tax=Fusarium fujikuroi TaxID=5127 RepID=A0A2H3RJU7_FUSFU|nr:related to nucleoside-diphosphate-sugar epimerase [Fusarium fujikuroi]SCN68983.1 related to nucleoside-diphosphate-sugar epimerase [Fusarium fujikuroi]SCN94137.1 related to nucleoside-diphosphate-sugar epimerase [Fusarium fujikuroi]SCO28279.1 related to nucleoside-diphosphate-sugar epimerase [Fusarium fujikuroi]SCO30786.1 related to nucleoside-diphosphate-sugar epimerase [Fusarium fujikuroi]